MLLGLRTRTSTLLLGVLLSLITITCLRWSLGPLPDIGDSATEAYEYAKTKLDNTKAKISNPRLKAAGLDHEETTPTDLPEQSGSPDEKKDSSRLDITKEPTSGGDKKKILDLDKEKEKIAVAEKGSKDKKKSKGDKHSRPIPPPLPEYFPLAAAAKSAKDLPLVPSWNRPPKRHVPEKTPLYIAFTRYWPLLQQTVVAYIASGWPPEDIYVVENTNTFDANRHGRLTSQNPFYLDYHRLTKIFGVNVITTPSYQSFAQLQNFYLSEAIRLDLKYYFWGHMDVLPTTYEDKEPYKSLYELAVDKIRETQQPDYGLDPETGVKKDWAIQFFSYDWLSLVNTAAYQKIGGWDPMISYYGSDCDMHNRIGMLGYIAPIADAGTIWDVDRPLPDLEVLMRRKRKGEASIKAGDEDKAASEKRSLAIRDVPDIETKAVSQSSDILKEYLADTEEDLIGSRKWAELRAMGKKMQDDKRASPDRNRWQKEQRGGQNEPYYQNPDGWEESLQRFVSAGVQNAESKWGHVGCKYAQAGYNLDDAWRQYKGNGTPGERTHDRP